MKIIDKLAWIEIQNGKLLSTRIRGRTKYYIPGGKREAGESEEVVFLTYQDRHLVSPVDQIIFDWLKEQQRLR